MFAPQRYFQAAFSLSQAGPHPVRANAPKRDFATLKRCVHDLPNLKGQPKGR